MQKHDIYCYQNSTINLKIKKNNKNNLYQEWDSNLRPRVQDLLFLLTAKAPLQCHMHA
jgi:hypothetical protein